MSTAAPCQLVISISNPRRLHNKCCSGSHPRCSAQPPCPYSSGCCPWLCSHQARPTVLGPRTAQLPLTSQPHLHIFPQEAQDSRTGSKSQRGEKRGPTGPPEGINQTLWPIRGAGNNRMERKDKAQKTRFISSANSEPLNFSALCPGTSSGPCQSNAKRVRFYQGKGATWSDLYFGLNWTLGGF